MQTHRSQRPAQSSFDVSRTVLAVVRILIASYFLATATGLIFEPGARTIFNAILLEQHAQMAATIYLFVTAFAVMVGKAVRPAALLLAVYIFWSGFLHFNEGSDPAALSGFWRDMALLGAVLLVAVTEPGGSTKFRLWRKPVAPRRVVHNMSNEASVRPARPTHAQANVQSASVSAALANAMQSDSEEDITNIFSDIWENNLAAA